MQFYIHIILQYLCAFFFLLSVKRLSQDGRLLKRKEISAVLKNIVALLTSEQCHHVLSVTAARQSINTLLCSFKLQIFVNGHAGCSVLCFFS